MHKAAVLLLHHVSTHRVWLKFDLRVWESFSENRFEECLLFLSISNWTQLMMFCLDRGELLFVADLAKSTAVTID